MTSYKLPLSRYTTSWFAKSSPPWKAHWRALESTFNLCTAMGSGRPHLADQAAAAAMAIADTRSLRGALLWMTGYDLIMTSAGDAASTAAPGERPGGDSDGGSSSSWQAASLPLGLVPPLAPLPLPPRSFSFRAAPLDLSRSLVPMCVK